jgi:hypothetical protein
MRGFLSGALISKLPLYRFLSLKAKGLFQMRSSFLAVNGGAR